MERPVSAVVREKQMVMEEKSKRLPDDFQVCGTLTLTFAP